ncbi:MAG TPA: hypothetical protein VN651_01550 [Gemmatimonadaceae bacterium]|nr:hypothetical protein [Gemmatimonadaceae bacterium]
MTVEERVRIATEATALEAAGADWSLRHVVAVFGCATSTIYSTPWMMSASRIVGKSGRRWNPKELRNAQAIASGHVEARTGGSRRGCKTGHAPAP